MRLKPDYDYDAILEMLGDKCAGIIVISRIEEAVPKDFKLDDKHENYDTTKNILYWEKSWAPVRLLIQKTLIMDSSQFNYTLHPNYIVYARSFNPVIVIELIRDGKPIATEYFKLFKKDIF